jgi:tetratricopeptide (TPR) repeat protein
MSTPICSFRSYLLSSLLLAAPLLMAQSSAGTAKNVPSPQYVKDMNHQSVKDMNHQSIDWLAIQPHLPDPATATPERLELVGDVLRARRFPEDAIDYYIYALQRGGPAPALLNKLGVTNLELGRTEVARVYFQKTIRLKKKDAEAWNNLGAVEYLDRQFGNAISDYNHAIKLQKKSATFHANMGTALFEVKQFDRARHEFDVALTLDPDMADHHELTGISARMLSPEDHAHYCFEMARLYAHRGNEINMLHFLTLASEGGFDIQHEMGTDEVLAKYRKDPRVLILIQNAHALRSVRASVGEAPSLPPITPSGPAQLN